MYSSIKTLSTSENSNYEAGGEEDGDSEIVIISIAQESSTRSVATGRKAQASRQHDCFCKANAKLSRELDQRSIEN